MLYSYHIYYAGVVLTIYSRDLVLGCDTVRSGPDSRGVKPGPAGPGLKNIGTGPDWKPGQSSPSTRRAAKPTKYTKKG
jgi:hypothetical protein